MITVMIKAAMAKERAAATPDPTAKPRLGRPPKPGGRLPQVEVQRAYRARLKAAGKVVQVVDAGAAQAPISDFDPAKDGVFEREMVASMRDRLSSALSKLALREEQVTQLQKRTAYLEAELKTQGQHLKIALKDNVVLKQRLERTPARR